MVRVVNVAECDILGIKNKNLTFIVVNKDEVEMDDVVVLKGDYGSEGIIKAGRTQILGDKTIVSVRNVLKFEEEV